MKIDILYKTNYQRILITLLVVCVLWYLFFNRYEPLTVSSAISTPRIVGIRRAKRHFVFGPKGADFVRAAPVSTRKINCVQIECPEEFDADVVCWECHESR